MTRKLAFGFALTVFALGSGAMAQGPPHVIVRPDSVVWGPASPKLPPGAQFARVSGDPSRPGELYVFRAKLPDGYSVPPHWHPMDEHVTVIQGVLRLGFGTKFDSGALRDLPAGSYAMLPKDVPHYNTMRGETILQFHGIGPYDLTYVTAPDYPSMPQRQMKPEIIDAATGRRVNTVPLNGRLTDTAAPDIVNASPAGNRLFVALRGPVPLSGDPHNAIGSTPGLGIIHVTNGGFGGALASIVRITSPLQQGTQQPDRTACGCDGSTDSRPAEPASVDGRIRRIADG